jgi:hypothetical protein
MEAWITKKSIVEGFGPLIGKIRIFSLLVGLFLSQIEFERTAMGVKD